MNLKLSQYLQSYKSILGLGLPLLLGQIGTIAVSFADNIMVGRYSTDALASASFVNNVFNIAIFACLGFTYGLTPLFGAMFVRKENDGIGRTLRLGMRVNLIFTVIVMAIMGILYLNLDHLGQPEHLMPIIKPYYLIVLAGMIPMVIFNVFAQWLFGIGNTGLPTWIVLGANLFNVIGNYILIYGHFGAPELGLIGAGYSTLASRFLCAAVILAIFYMRRRYACYRPSFKCPELKPGDVKKIIKTGMPVSAQMFFETASFSGSAVMAGWLSSVDLAAFQIVVISGMLGFCIYYSIGGAMSIDISHAAGQADDAGMRRSAWAGYHLTLVAMLISSSLFIFLGRDIMGLFTEDGEVLALALTLIFPMVLYQFGDATQITFANALRGTSKVMPMLYIAFVAYVVVGLPVSYLFAFPMGLGLYGLVLSFSVCLLLAAVLYFVYFIKATGGNVKQ